jgi:hypothetical protein
MDFPAPGRYRHFKGGEYEVLSMARHSETEEWLVVYRPVADPESIWVRPLEMFCEMVGTRRRFEPITGDARI